MGKCTRGHEDPLLKLERTDCSSVNRDRDEGLTAGITKRLYRYITGVLHLTGKVNSEIKC